MLSSLQRNMTLLFIPQNRKKKIQICSIMYAYNRVIFDVAGGDSMIWMDRKRNQRSSNNTEQELNIGVPTGDRWRWGWSLCLWLHPWLNVVPCSCRRITSMVVVGKSTEGFFWNRNFQDCFKSIFSIQVGAQGPHMTNTTGRYNVESKWIWGHSILEGIVMQKNVW